jgi:hypothetical protein
MCGHTTGCRRSECDDGDADGVQDSGVVGIDAERGADLRRDARPSATPQRLADGGVPLRRVMEDVGEHRLKEELPSGEAFDEAHGAATAGTRPR